MRSPLLPITAAFAAGIWVAPYFYLSASEQLFFLGLILLGVGAFAGLPPVPTAFAYVIGAVALGTGAVGFCPVWILFGINTRPTKPDEKP